DAYDFADVSQEIHNFIAGDLSAFYLDFAKDILYIEHEDHPRRRSIQTVYYETLVSLVKLLAPIIPHTAEAVWEQIPETDNEYVHLTAMSVFHEVASVDHEKLTKWDHFMKVISDVLKALEDTINEI